VIAEPQDEEPPRPRKGPSVLDRALSRTVRVLRLVTALALVGMIVWIARTPGPRARVADFLDQAGRAIDEPIGETVQLLGGPADAVARAHEGHLAAGCALAVARLYGARCGRPAPKRLSARYAADVAACTKTWTPTEVACWAEGDCPTFPKQADCGP